MSTDEVDDLLRKHGIHPGNPRDRRALAERLAEEGFESTDMAVLWHEVVDRRQSTNPAGQVLSWLSRANWWPQIVEDMRYAHAHSRVTPRGDVQRTDVRQRKGAGGVE